MLEYKENNSITNKITTNNGLFYGYASVSNVEDSYNDIILNHAFADTLKNKKVEDINLLWQHNKENKIGKFNFIKEDCIGLYVEGEIDIKNNSNIYSYVKNGFIKGLSIGYKVDNAYFDDKGRRIIKKIDLIEISIVSFPANKHSNITYCKSLNNKYNPMQKLNESLERLINIFK